MLTKRLTTTLTAVSLMAALHASDFNYIANYEITNATSRRLTYNEIDRWDSSNVDYYSHIIEPYTIVTRKISYKTSNVTLNLADFVILSDQDFAGLSIPSSISIKPEWKSTKSTKLMLSEENGAYILKEEKPASSFFGF